MPSRQLGKRSVHQRAAVLRQKRSLASRESLARSENAAKVAKVLPFLAEQAVVQPFMAEQGGARRSAQRGDGHNGNRHCYGSDDREDSAADPFPFDQEARG